MAIITIEGITISLKTFSVTISDLDSDNTERNANGDMIRDWITEKRKIEMELNTLTQAKSSEFLAKVRQGAFVSVTYLDPELGTTTKVFYVSDRKLPLLKCTNNVPLWEGLSCSLIER